MSRKKYVPVILLFVFVTAMIFIFKPFLESNGFEISFLLIANAVLFLLSLAGSFIQIKGLKSTNINAFIRGVYSSLLLKLFIIMIAVIAYIFITGGKVNQPSLFTSMSLYFLYTALEVKMLMKIARKKSDA
ncbi:MAG: hypothetical protein M3Z56_00705 [Bacteroidota bacterium]|nr:hypothetical protein [Bacteroidota bacterium]